ncbi:hypothetical protein R3P38DRAFT_2766053 [Favolaschia claudopus]|uniref:Maturase K n=1 Tax=Favolaschia claudopus TaxID=2862362 RepID=A0AAW0CW31_9AGAR
MLTLGAGGLVVGKEQGRTRGGVGRCDQINHILAQTGNSEHWLLPPPSTSARPGFRCPHSSGTPAKRQNGHLHAFSKITIYGTGSERLPATSESVLEQSDNSQRRLYVPIDDSPLFQLSAFLDLFPLPPRRYNLGCHIISHMDLVRRSTIHFSSLNGALSSYLFKFKIGVTDGLGLRGLRLILRFPVNKVFNRLVTSNSVNVHGYSPQSADSVYGRNYEYLNSSLNAPCYRSILGSLRRLGYTSIHSTAICLKDWVRDVQQRPKLRLFEFYFKSTLCFHFNAKLIQLFSPWFCCHSTNTYPRDRNYNGRPGLCRFESAFNFAYSFLFQLHAETMPALPKLCRFDLSRARASAKRSEKVYIWFDNDNLFKYRLLLTFVTSTYPSSTIEASLAIPISKSKWLILHLTRFENYLNTNLRLNFVTRAIEFKQRLIVGVL